MNLNKCQFDAIAPCCNRGDICLRSREERAFYNNVIDQMISKLNSLKLPDEDSTVPLPENFVGCGKRTEGIDDDDYYVDDECYDDDCEE